MQTALAVLGSQTQNQVTATEAATGDTVVGRDSNADSNFRRVNASQAMVSLGGVQAATVTKTATYTAAITDFLILCDATSGAITLNLPAASGCAGWILCIKKIDAVNNVTIDPAGAELIDGSATAVLSSQWASKLIQCNGTAWYVLAS